MGSIDRDLDLSMPLIAPAIATPSADVMDLVPPPPPLLASSPTIRAREPVVSGTILPLDQSHNPQQPPYQPQQHQRYPPPQPSPQQWRPQHRPHPSPNQMATVLQQHGQVQIVDQAQIEVQQVGILQRQGFPAGLARDLVEQTKATYPVRFWVVDNSGSMLANDGCELRGDSDSADAVLVPCTRWAELRSAVIYHAKLATLLQATTVFRFLNDPGARTGPQEFTVAGADGRSQGFFYDEAASTADLDFAVSVIKKASPKGSSPLTSHLQEIRQRVEAMMLPSLDAAGQSVVLVLATDGLPSNLYGDSTEEVLHEFVANLKALQNLPVWIVIRLCTDDEAVVDFYNKLDADLELPLEVVDDFISEAKEILRVNGWLNYTMPLHRCREIGYHNRIFDLLDERLLNKDELREFLQLLFGANSLSAFPDAYTDWKGFMGHLSKLVASHGKFYNPCTNKHMPLIDVKRLEKCYKHEQRGSPRSVRSNSSGSSSTGRGFFRRRR